MDIKTPTDALKFVLSVRLRFGDPDQIQAIDILSAAEELIGKECPECEGTGESDSEGYCDNCGRACDHCGDHCEYCNGQGTLTRDHVYRLTLPSIQNLLVQKKAA